MLARIFGSKNGRELKRMGKIVAQINKLETDFESLSDDELKASTVKFRERLDAGEKLDALLPEAFAAVREAGKRTMQMRHSHPGTPAQ